jgi:hypothetical protein
MKEQHRYRYMINIIFYTVIIIIYICRSRGGDVGVRRTFVEIIHGGYNRCLLTQVVEIHRLQIVAVIEWSEGKRQ